MIILTFFVIHWYTSLFFQTFFLHRYAAHQMFTMSRFWERMFRILTFVTQGSSYINPHTYGILHRLHHEHADTELDVHSPKYDKTFIRMMLRTAKIYDGIFFGRYPVDEKYKKNLPEWFIFDRIAEFWAVRIAVGSLYVFFYMAFADYWWMYFLLPVHFFMGPIHGAIINWWAHKWGYTNFPVDDTSKNILPFDFLMMGEGYHNNHHKHGSRPNFGFRWFEIDPSYLWILLFDKLHIIRLKKVKKVDLKDKVLEAA